MQAISSFQHFHPSQWAMMLVRCVCLALDVCYRADACGNALDVFHFDSDHFTLQTFFVVLGQAVGT